MARKTPTLEIYDNAIEFYAKGKATFETMTDYIEIDTDGNETWFDWLGEGDNKSFKVVVLPIGFTARKELRGGIAYWYAYKKIGKKLHKRYVGQSLDTTPRQLRHISQRFETIKIHGGQTK